MAAEELTEAEIQAYLTEHSEPPTRWPSCAHGADPISCGECHG